MRAFLPARLMRIFAMALAAILASESQSIDGARAAEIDKYSYEVVKSTQVKLRQLGYEPGPEDGVYGERTRRAIRQYQRDLGLEPMGEPTTDLLAQLSRSLAQPYGQDLQHRYLAQIRRALQSATRKYLSTWQPRHQGMVQLRLILDWRGRVISPSVEKSSGYPSLDQAALDILHNAAPFNRLPAQLKGSHLELVVPMTFERARTALSQSDAPEASAEDSSAGADQVVDNKTLCARPSTSRSGAAGLAIPVGLPDLPASAIVTVPSSFSLPSTPAQKATSERNLKWIHGNIANTARVSQVLYQDWNESLAAQILIGELGTLRRHQGKISTNYWHALLALFPRSTEPDMQRRIAEDQRRWIEGSLFKAELRKMNIGATSAVVKNGSIIAYSSASGVVERKNVHYLLARKMMCDRGYSVYVDLRVDAAQPGAKQQLDKYLDLVSFSATAPSKPEADTSYSKREETRVDTDTFWMMASITFLVLLAIIAMVSLLLDHFRRKKHPSTQPFRWGYFTSIQSMLMGAIVFLVVLTHAHQPSEFGGLIIGLILFVPGYYAARRRKWAWIVNTILSFNPIWWIINWMYGSKRWGEFEAEAAQRRS